MVKKSLWVGHFTSDFWSLPTTGKHARMDENFFSLRFTWKWYHSIRLVKANLACYSMVDFERKFFFRPFSRVWVLIVVPKSENVDFRPTFCPFSRLTDLVQQNQDYHRTRREKAVIISPTCIFRFFGTTDHGETCTNGRKFFFSQIHLKMVPFDSSRHGESSVL